MQMSTRKIAFLYFSEYFSCSRGRKQVEFLAKYGIDVDVYAFNSGSQFNLKSEGKRPELIRRFPIYFFTKKYRIGYLSRPVGAICFFVWLFTNSLKHETLHLHSPMLLPAAIFAKLLRMLVGKSTYIIYDCHEVEWAKSGVSATSIIRIKLFELLFIKLVDVVVTVSPKISTLYCDRYKISNVFTVSNFPNLGVNHYAQNKSSLRIDFSIPEDAIVFVYVGRLTKTRGLEEWIEAVSALDKQYNMHLVIIGYGPLYDYCDRLSLLHANVHLREVMEQREMVDYIMGCDYGINTPALSSLSRTLALPNKLFEYMSAGLKTIVCDNSYRAEFVRTYDCGVVIEDGKLASISKFLSQPLAPVDKKTRKQMVVLSKAFQWSSQEEVLKKIYKIST